MKGVIYDRAQPPFNRNKSDLFYLFSCTCPTKGIHPKRKKAWMMTLPPLVLWFPPKFITSRTRLKSWIRRISLQDLKRVTCAWPGRKSSQKKIDSSAAECDERIDKKDSKSVLQVYEARPVFRKNIAENYLKPRKFLHVFLIFWTGTWRGIQKVYILNSLSFIKHCTT